MFEEYLNELLGEEKSNSLKKALDKKQLIVIQGAYGSGKTTLANVLRKKGYNVAEDFEVYNLTLDKELDNIVPNKESTIHIL